MKTVKVPASSEIQAMFDRLAPQYDRFNRWVSLGLDGLWRAEVLKSVQEGDRVLDLGCGTGDLTIGAASRILTGEVTGLDFSEAMLRVARLRAARFRSLHKRNASIRFMRGSAEDLPIEKKPFDLVISGFVLRNIYEHIEKIMRGVHASLKSGGRIAFVDFTQPEGTVRRALWNAYMNTAGAVCGRLAFGKDYPSFYLTDSARRFLSPEEFCALLRESGFENLRLRRFMSGIIVVYEAEKA